MLDGFWRRRFPGQTPDEPNIPESLEGELIELEGQAVIPIDTGYTDTAGSTSLDVPSMGLIVAGDVVYNGIHPYLGRPTRTADAVDRCARQARWRTASYL